MPNINKTDQQPIRDAIIKVLRMKIALSTDMLTDAVGRALGLPCGYYTGVAFKSRVYRAAVRLEEGQWLHSAKVFKGKAYERVWRIG